MTRSQRHWISIFALLTLVSLALAPFASAQEKRFDSSDQLATAEVLQEGMQLEQDRRWSEAIHLYEKASKRFPQDSDLRRRLLISRIHFDVTRRYRDVTYRDSVARLNSTQAGELYLEILAKLEANYVDPLNLNEVLRNGTAFLEVALTEPVFLAQHLPNASPEQVEQFRLAIHRDVLGQEISNRFEARQLVLQVAKKAEQQIGLAVTATVYEYVCGAVGLLDPYSGFLTEGELTEMTSQIEGNFVGLGVELRPLGQKLNVVSVIRGGPAALAGIQPDDEILSVDGITTSAMGADHVADLLRGPEGSKVVLSLNRGNETIAMDVIRKRVEVPSIEAVHIIDPKHGVGYLRITNFQKTTDEELDKALWELQKLGMRSLIMDVRGNPGGLLETSVRVADKFIPEGLIVSTRGRNGIENKNFTAHRAGTWQMPLYLLIDGDSASASEILAGAIRDHRRGLLIGTTTYGKGSVQGLYNTEVVRSGLRLTVSKFYSPKGTPIAQLGVGPDIKVDLDRYVMARPIIDASGREIINPATAGGDRILQTALEQARAGQTPTGHR
jgi:carboxyl-terminal processing protease